MDHPRARRGANFFCCCAAVIKLTDDVDLVTLYAPYAPQRDTRASRVREPRIAFTE